MGITIHYSAIADSERCVRALVDALKRHCVRHGYKFKEVDESCYITIYALESDPSEDMYRNKKDYLAEKWMKVIEAPFDMWPDFRRPYAFIDMSLEYLR